MLLHRSARAAVEALEARKLLTVSVAPWIDPYFVTGTTWTSQQTNPDTGDVTTFVATTKGSTTFNGNAATEMDTTAGSTFLTKTYSGIAANGDYVLYGGALNIDSAHQNDTYTPYQVELPAQLTAGVTVTDTDTNDSSLTNSSGDKTDKSTETRTFTLQSETPTSITVPAGTYMAYEVIVVDSSLGTDGSTSGPDTTDSWYAPGFGLVKSTNDSDRLVTELVSFNNVQEHLEFGQPMTAVGIAKVIQPPVTVSVKDPTGAVDANATGSVTLALRSASRLGVSTGTLGGTVSEPLVGGVATFSNLTVSAGGTYQLVATDTNGDTSATSNKFKVGTSLGLEVTAHGAIAKGVTTGDRIRYTVLTTPHKAIQSQQIVVTLPNGFTPDSITGQGQVSGNTITWSAPKLRLADFSITVPDAKTLAGSSQIIVSGIDDVVYADSTTDEATASSSVDLRQRLSFLQNVSNVAVNGVMKPAVKVAVMDAGGNVETSSTDTVTLTVAAGPSRLLGTVSVQAVGGVAIFNDLHVAAAGKYILLARDVTTPKSFTPTRSDAFAAVSLKSIAGKLGAQKKISADTSLNITNANAFAVPKAASDMTFTGLGLSTHDPALLPLVKWAVVRNDSDVVTGDAPALTPTSNPLLTGVSMNASGSFNVICYFDADGNGSFDNGEQLRVFHLAEVAFTILSRSTVTPHSDHFTESASQGSTIISSGDFTSNYAIEEDDFLQVVGGGPDGMLGVKKVHLGLIQNGTSDDVTVTYANGKTMTEKLLGGRSFPVLDASYPPSRSHPDQIFDVPKTSHPVPPAPGPIRDPAYDTDPTGGEDRVISTVDSPNVVFRGKFGTSPAISVDGTNDFSDYIAAFSDDFKATYAGYFRTAWSARFAYAVNSSGAWQNTASNVAASSTTISEPVILTSMNVKTTGPIFARIARFV